MRIALADVIKSTEIKIIILAYVISLFLLLLGKRGIMDLFKKHVDTVIILTAFAGAMLWLNGKFNELEKDMAIMKTVLIMKDIMPLELAKKED